MRELTMRRDASPIDEAAFDALLQQAAERVVASAAADGTGARVVARLRTAPPRHGVAIGLGGAAAMACAAVLAMLWLPAPRDVSSPASAGAARPAVSLVTAPADRPAPAGPADVSMPQPDGAVAVVGAAQVLAAPGVRRRQRASVRDVPVPADDPSTVSLLPVTGALQLGRGADESGDALAPPPLPVDALALESLDAAALGPQPER